MGEGHFIDALNDAQREAVVNYDRPSLIVAGAGSGKTRVLTSRIAYMIEQGVYPGSILALTFTNKAAAEMRERIKSLVGEGRSRYIWMGTFHSVFYRILRSEADKLGFNSNFTIYDSGNSESLLNTVIKGLNLNTDIYKAREIHSRISLAKNNLVTAEAYAANTSLLAEDRRARKPELYSVYLEYSRRCKANNAMDFDDLLIYTNILFRDFPDVLAFYQERFKYVLVDEYQDTNFAQYLIIRKLAQGSSNICVVGDDAQSIYSFRGAKIENILQFRNDFPDAQVYKLEQNYRSTRNIVDAANSIIAKNANRIEKTVFSEKAEGDKIRVVRAYTDQEEAYLVADMIKARGRETNENWSEIAVLYRNNSQSRSIEDALRRRNIPYIIYKGHSFYERKEIKDLVAYFRLIVNPSDDEAFKRIINTPARGIGLVSVARIADLAQERGKSMWETVDGLEADNPELKSAVKRIREFVELIRGFSLERHTKTLYEFGLDVATRSGIIGSYKIEGSPESESALENINELLASMENFKENRIVIGYDDDREGGPGAEDMDPAGEGTVAEGDMEDLYGEPTIEEWLQNISLMTDMDKLDEEAKNRVVLMTVHAAKGLEFDNVFIVGVEENLFPSTMSGESPEKLEEERRLFYVALTRAREKAVISFANSRFKWGNTEFCRPSRFISEIDEQYLELPADSASDDDPMSELRRKYAEGNKKIAAYRQAGRSQNMGGGGYYKGGGSYTGVARQGNPESYKPKQASPINDVNRMARDSNFKSAGARRNGPDPELSRSSDDAQQIGAYKVGMIVEHSKFGRGEIVALENISSDIKITVVFEDEAAGKKSLLSKYAKLGIVNDD